jgi:SNF2 family DNA or RNA helicase
LTKEFCIRYTKDECLNLPGKEIIIETIDNPGHIERPSELQLETVTTQLVEAVDYKASNCREIIDKYIKEAKNGKITLWLPFKSIGYNIMDIISDLNPIFINGDVGAYDRHNMLNSFRKDDSIKAAVLITRACREGITIINTNTVIYLGGSFDLADLQQLQDRVYRIGQDTKCKIVIVKLENSIDDHIDYNLDDKIDLSTTVQNDKQINYNKIAEIMEGIE